MPGAADRMKLGTAISLSVNYNFPFGLEAQIVGLLWGVYAPYLASRFPC